MDDTRKALTDKRASLTKTIEKYAKVLASGDDLTDEQLAEYQDAVAEAKKIDTKLDLMDEADAVLNRNDESAGRGTTSVRVGFDRGVNDPMLGYNTFAEFARDVRAACARGSEYGVPSDKFTRYQQLVAERHMMLGDPRAAAPTNFNRELVGTEGGYETLPAMAESVWEVYQSEQGIINRFNVAPTEANTIELNADETTPWGADGVQAYWAAEGSQLTNSQLKTVPRQIRLEKLYAYVLATDELLSDAPRFQDRITRKAGLALNWKASEAIIYGTGAGQPLGIFNSGALVSVPGEPGQALDTIVIDNIVKMRSRLFTGSGLRGAFWLANPDTLPEIYTLTISNQPVWTVPGTGAREEPGGVLLGMPLVFSEHAKTLGDKGDIFLIAPDGYAAYQKSGGVSFASSIHLYFDYDITAFRWTMRLGGQPRLSAPISPASGSGNTYSHFVTLNAR